MMAAQIFCIGVNHETAPLAIREALACTPPAANPSLGSECPHISEWALLSTCNRVEVYAASDTTLEIAAPHELLITHFGDIGHDLEQHMYVLNGEQAANHLLRVASGLDSMVLGEAQILGQVKQSFTVALKQKSIGPILTALFRAALMAGKRVRSETAIGCNPASIPSVAISQAQSRLGSLHDSKILLIGAGAMAQTAVKALRARDYSHITIANRTLAHAQSLAAAWDGQAYGLDALPQVLVEADVVFAATHADRLLLAPEMLGEVMEQRGGRPMLLFDLAVPRDIDTRVDAIPGVSLIDLDRLRADLDESLTARRKEVPAAEAIIAEEAGRLDDELAEIAIRPVLVELRQRAEAIRRREVARTLRHLGDVDDETLQHINHLSQALVNQLLHEPTKRLRAEATGERPEEMADAVSELFNLNSPNGE
jgi:glutamyl-tRNA reductase